MSEWLRSVTRNHIGSACAGSSPAAVSHALPIELAGQMKCSSYFIFILKNIFEIGRLERGANNAKSKLNVKLPASSIGRALWVRPPRWAIFFGTGKNETRKRSPVSSVGRAA
ncbi:hypothetical protein H8356DRAFT_1438098 [Neocallimastix lanati (nom. inval.)]|nr:hypothetical protein H8356DRAFT_1438098 [Neocallimastix sp. JGI-2020a]